MIGHGLTQRQHDALQFIRSYMAEHDGLAPSYGEISDALGLRSKSRVSRIVRDLEERGAIVFRVARARSIKDHRMRREFSRQTKLAAFQRCKGRCEGTKPDGQHCGSLLMPGRFAYDHNTPDGLTGEPTLENCRVLCLPCHAAKTKGDVAKIAKAKRIEAKHAGIRSTSRPMPGSKRSGWRKRMDGAVERRT